MGHPRKFRKILIANRGEIAVRLIRACRELGIRSVAVFSEADRAALHVRLADEAYPIGPAPSRESYLVIEKIIGAACYSNCSALHPGYGFLAENPELARACSDVGITFIGPSPEAIEKLGPKTQARHVARAAHVPTVPGTLDPLRDLGEARKTAAQTGYPVLLKAVAGGGGKGMRLVEQEEELPAAWRDASSEALNSFGDERLFMERLVPRPHHVEIQILGDLHGNIVHLCERECSVQRRHQKVLEESPSPLMTPELRRAMGEAAVRLAKAGGYTNAGTMEFLVDDERNFYFLEMNTRLQVEHPVTELVTSLDLPKLQIRIAEGKPLPFTQEQISQHGHAIECRIYAEDPENNFLPSPGKILRHASPGGPGIRTDDGVYSGWTVPNEYDPMLSKVIAWGKDRDEAIARMKRALGEYCATGIRTNLDLFRRILEAPEFVGGKVHTQWLDEWLPSAMQTPRQVPDGAREAAIVAAAYWFANEIRGNAPAGNVGAQASQWKQQARIEQVSRYPGNS